MKLKWLGHSCFLLTDSRGKTILTDPFDATVGYPLPDLRVDLVLSSHDHFDHHATQGMPESAVLIDTAGAHTAAGFALRGFESFHDDARGAKRGKNIIYVVEIDGLRVCHLGDLGHMLSDEAIRSLGRIDCLLIPVGGVFTINGDTAAALAEKIGAAITIPMHYKTNYLRFDVSGEGDFARAAGAKRLGADEVTLDGESIKKMPRALILRYGAKG